MRPAAKISATARHEFAAAAAAFVEFDLKRRLGRGERGRQEPSAKPDRSCDPAAGPVGAEAVWRAAGEASRSVAKPRMRGRGAGGLSDVTLPTHALRVSSVACKLCRRRAGLPVGMGVGGWGVGRRDG